MNMTAILMMSAKCGTPTLFKIRVFWNKDYYVVSSTHDVINKSYSHGSNWNIDVIMGPKFGNFSISIREVIVTSVL